MCRSIILLVISLLPFLSSLGATVIWDAFEQDGNCFYYYGGPTPEINFAVEVYPSVIFAKAEGPVNIANPRAYWVEANAGDVVDNDFMFSDVGRLVFDVYYTDRSEIVEGYTVAAMKDSTFYLALIVDDAIYYGWLAIDVDSNGVLHLAHSALSSEPGIVVGAIPEPSSGVLLLLGVAGLALGRKRLNRGDAYMLCVHEMPSVPFSACVLISSHLIPANPGEVSSGLWYNCAQGILSTRNTRSAK